MSIEERNAEQAERRAAATTRMNKDPTNDWIQYDMDNYRLSLAHLPPAEDKATFEKPHAYSEGIDYVLVNGVAVLENGKHTGQKSGDIIYGKGKIN